MRLRPRLDSFWPRHAPALVACVLGLAAAAWSPAARADDGDDSSPGRAHALTSAAAAPRAVARPDSPGLGAGLALTALGSAALDTALVFLAASALDGMVTANECDATVLHCPTPNPVYPAVAAVAGAAGVGLLSGGIAMIVRSVKRTPAATRGSGTPWWIPMPSGVAVDRQGARLTLAVAW
jgi:hypothetical protein